jgi:hypothetical protein
MALLAASVALLNRFLNSTHVSPARMIDQGFEVELSVRCTWVLTETLRFDCA